MAALGLEETRRLHEDAERLERMIVEDLQREAKTHRDRLFQDHRVAAMLARARDRAARLVEVYEDADGSRAREVAALRGADPVAAFYARLRETRSYHRRVSGSVELTDADDGSALRPPEEPPLGSFSGEEALGRFLDLLELHAAYRNAPFAAHPEASYGEYVSGYLGNFRAATKGVGARSSAAYRAYLEALAGYLEGFLRRTQPLLARPPGYERDLEKEFEEAWADGRVPGWEDVLGGSGPGAGAGGDSEGGTGGADAADGADGPRRPSSHLLLEAGPSASDALDLSAYDTKDELEMLGPERLAAALDARSLKKGGTLRERAARLLSVRGLSPAEVPFELYQKGKAPPGAPRGKGAKAGGAKGRGEVATTGRGDPTGRDAAAGKAAEGEAGRGAAGEGGGGVQSKHLRHAKEAARLEARVTRALASLAGVVRATAARAERRLAQTWEEMQAEQAEREADGMGGVAGAGAGGVPGGSAAAGPGAGSDEEGSDDEPVYNPLKLPLGPDGRPIPFWMYRLHGLNLKFPCEICGGEVYRGRRAFERHFREPKHAAGMKALGVPNSKAFFEVTKIADALALWETIREKRAETTDSALANGEEVEDDEGNVFDARTYADLRRQGLA